MFNRVHMLAAGFILAATVSVAQAQNCGVIGNLVPNCGFDVDETGWVFSADGVDGETEDCTTGPRCVSVDQHDLTSSLEAWSACVPVVPSTYYTFGGWLRAVEGTISQGCAVTIVGYSNGTCGMYQEEGYFQRLPSSGWRQHRAGMTLSAATQSAQVRLSCYDNLADFILRIDDAFLVPAIFVDGFESGDRSFWSFTVP